MPAGPSGEDLLSQLYEEFRVPLLHFCQAMLRSPEEAEDAVQHTFLSAFRALRAGVQPVMPKPWLYTIARNCCLTMLRARRPPAPQPGWRPTDPAERLELHESVSELLGDVAELPEEQRTALMLSELGELSHAEISQVLGCNRAKVKSLVFRARGTLKEARDARDTPCETIREQLVALRGGSLRRGELRRHLKECSSCAEFRWQVARERAGAAALLPIPVGLGLQNAGGQIAAAVGAGGVSSAGGLGVLTGTLGLLTGKLGFQTCALAVAASMGLGIGGSSLRGEREDSPGPASPAMPTIGLEGAAPPLVRTDRLDPEASLALVAPAALLPARSDGRHGGRGAGKDGRGGPTATSEPRTAPADARALALSGGRGTPGRGRPHAVQGGPRRGGGRRPARRHRPRPRPARGQGAPAPHVAASPVRTSRPRGRPQRDMAHKRAEREKDRQPKTAPDQRTGPSASAPSAHAEARALPAPRADRDRQRGT